MNSLIYHYETTDSNGTRLVFVGDNLPPQFADMENLAYSIHGDLSAHIYTQYMADKDVNTVFFNYVQDHLLKRKLDLSPREGLQYALSVGIIRLTKHEVADDKNDEQTQLRIEIQQTLNQIVVQEKNQTKILQQQLEQETTTTQVLIYTGAFMQGIGSSVWGLATWVKEVSDVVNPVVIAYNSFKAATASYGNDNQFSDELLKLQYRELVQALGFDPSQISQEQLKTAFETLEVVWADNDLKKRLTFFCKEYAQAQHSITITNVAGSAIFEIIFAAVLVAVTGGTALTVTATVRAGHKIRQFKTLGTLLAKFADQTPQMRKKKAELKQQTTPSIIYDDVGESMAIKTADNTLLPKSAKQKLPTPPKTMDEVHQRIDVAKVKLDTARANGQPLPTSPYSEADKFAMVNAGLQEKFLVRVVESGHASDAGTIAKPGTTNYWTTSYTQVEHADSDAKLLCQTLGVNYDPNKKYSMLIIDNQKATKSGQMNSFTPTYDSLGNVAKSEISGTNPAHIDKVMTPDYSVTYAKHMEDAKAGGINLSESKQLSDFAAQKGLSAEDKKLLETRQEINKKYGANEHFTGNGLTKDNNAPAGKIQYGTVETVTQDKNPQTIGVLKKQGVIDVVALN